MKTRSVIAPETGRWKLRPFGWSALMVLTLGMLGACQPACAQSGGAAGAGQGLGLLYYAIQNRDSSKFILRGKGTGQPWQNLILAPNAHFRAWVLQASTLLIGFSDFTTPAAGQSSQIPALMLVPDNSPDTDGDGLHDTSEDIVGTSKTNPDTNGDGIKDGPEVQQGLDPLGGLIAATGILASANIPGLAQDVCAGNNIAIVAEPDGTKLPGGGTTGAVSVFNVFNGMNPTLVAQVPTPGPALRVACSGSLIAVADGGSGLSVIDITDPPASSVVHQIPLSGNTQAVASSGGLAYYGTSGGEIGAVDLASGVVLSRVSVTGPVNDLTLDGDALYALTNDHLLSLSITDGVLQVDGNVASPGFTHTRLFVGGGIGYAVQTQGVNTFNLSNPMQPALIQHGVTTQNGWTQLAVNGNGLGVAVLGAFPGARHDLSLYDFSDPTKTNVFIATFQMPQDAKAVSLYNGLAYVADGTAGLQVVNYLSFDTAGVPPTIQLSLNVDPASVLEGTPLHALATTTDDVQVRSVDFYVNGTKVFSKGAFPFDYRFVAPPASQMSTLKLKAIASDTGGNTATSAEITIHIVPDTSPLHVTRTSPRTNGIVSQAATISASFSKSISPATLNPGTFQLFSLTGTAIPRYQPVDLSFAANGRLQSLDGRYPEGNVLLSGVPFILGKGTNNVWFSEYASGNNPRVLDIPVNAMGVTEVQTLINTFYGQPGPTSYASLEFFGSGGAYFKKDLIGGVDIRDYNQNTWTNSTSAATTQEVINFDNDQHRLDKQTIALPAAFTGQTLSRIRLSDNGNFNFQHTFLAGVTLNLGALPALDANTAIPGGTVTYTDLIRTGSLNFNFALPAGIYRAQVAGGVTDTAGNALPGAYAWTFYLVGGDANTDFTGSKLFYLGGPPAETLLTGMTGTGQLKPNVTIGGPPLTSVLTGPGGAKGLKASTTVGQPPVTTVLTGPGGAKGLKPSTTVGQPPVTTVLTGPGGAGSQKPNTTVGQPPVTAKIAGH